MGKLLFRKMRKTLHTANQVQWPVCPNPCGWVHFEIAARSLTIEQIGNRSARCPTACPPKLVVSPALHGGSGGKAPKARDLPSGTSSHFFFVRICLLLITLNCKFQLLILLRAKYHPSSPVSDQRFKHFLTCFLSASIAPSLL
ncbi:hypothetical protein VTK73DRAFT_75 [Phialemonium thermophilum]|uniref:Uncharacterized protein n=1 Tax=Phialemonium thermophilum TaxID=223376 RepID=A0ABR3Y8V8_9PEZI